MATINIDFESVRRTVCGLDFDGWVERLNLEGAQWRGERDVLCRCPAHNDNSPSLHVVENGALLVHCFAGCSVADVAACLADPLPRRPQQSRVARRPSAVVARYAYSDPEGVVAYRKTRYEPRSFSFERAEHRPALTGPVTMAARTVWVPGLKDAERNLLVTLYPYRLPALLAACGRGEDVFIVDGESDVEALGTVGVVATCGPTGMERWLPEFNTYLTGARSVTIVADNDDGPGPKAANAIFGQLDGFTRRVVVSPVGKDSRDLIESGGSVSEFVEVRRA